MTAKKEGSLQGVIYGHRGTGATRGDRETHRHGLVLKTEHCIVQATDTEKQRHKSTKHATSLPLLQFYNAWPLAKPPELYTAVYFK